MLAEQSVLLIVDIQARLFPAIHDAEKVLSTTLWLAGVAQKLQVPVIVTEQNPGGLGGSVPEVAALVVQPDCLVEKIYFSAVVEGDLLKAPGAERHQWVVVGTESHVCVQQTVLDLLDLGRKVYVVEEGVGSRCPSDKQLALERMCRHGADIVSREMVAFEWLARADTPVFRQVLKEFIR